jgi:lactate racemase
MRFSRVRSLSLRYGAGVQEATLPSDWNSLMPGPASPRVKQAGHDIISSALGQPLAAPRLRDAVHGDSIVILVPDKTRNAATAMVLPLLIDELEHAGVRDEHITIVFATGTHPPQSVEEQRELLGPAILKRYTVVQHNARNNEECIHVGDTCYGTPVALNRIVANADFVVLAGTIVHHYFAGFGGGAKMFLPGVAAYNTAVINHKRTLTPDGRFHQGCRDGNTTGNPVLDDIHDALRFCPPHWYVATVIDAEGDIAAAVCGDLRAAHEKGCSIVHEMFSIPLQKDVDICIASAGGYPRDINFIQAHKSIHHAHYALREGGTLICLAECREGVGNETFHEYFQHRDEAAFRDAVLNQYSMNAHTALAVREKSLRFRIIMVTGLAATLMDQMGIEKASSLQEAISLAGRGQPASPDVLILPNASLSVPVHTHSQSSDSWNSQRPTVPDDDCSR